MATEHVIWIRHGRLDENVLRANGMAKFDHHCFTWMLKQWFLYLSLEIFNFQAFSHLDQIYRFEHVR